MKLHERFHAHHGELSCPDSSVVADALTGDTVADFPSPRSEPDGPLARRQAARAEFLAHTLNCTPRITVGMTVRAPDHIEIFPHFITNPGATGVVVEIQDGPGGQIWIHMDDHVPGCEEWSNEIQCFDKWVGEPMTLRECFDEEWVATGYAEYTYGDEGHVEGICDLASLLSQDGLSHDEQMALRALRVGESVTLGGGAFATSVIERLV